MYKIAARYEAQMLVNLLFYRTFLKTLNGVSITDLESSLVLNGLWRERNYTDTMTVIRKTTQGQLIVL